MNISLKISILSLIISIGTVFFEYFFNKKINSINLDAEYFNDIFKDFLIEHIPEKRAKVQRTSSGNIIGIDPFLDLLRKIRKKSLFFKFKDREFYNELLSTIQELEDELVLIESPIDIDEYNKHMLIVDSKINSFYDVVLYATRGKIF